MRDNDGREIEIGDANGGTVVVTIHGQDEECTDGEIRRVGDGSLWFTEPQAIEFCAALLSRFGLKSIWSKNEKMLKGKDGRPFPWEPGGDHSEKVRDAWQEAESISNALLIPGWTLEEYARVVCNRLDIEPTRANLIAVLRECPEDFGDIEHTIVYLERELDADVIQR